MKILTRTNADWRATLNVVTNEKGTYGWEVDVYNLRADPVARRVYSPTDFVSSTNAAVDGLRAMDGLTPSDQVPLRATHDHETSQ
jgi:hypothetical protein